jgi:hypothetical protein
VDPPGQVPATLPAPAQPTPSEPPTTSLGSDAAYVAAMTKKIQAQAKYAQAPVKQTQKAFRAKPKLKYEPEFDEGPLGDEAPVTAGQHMAKPPAPKPKLRIGIWS